MIALSPARLRYMKLKFAIVNLQVKKIWGWENEKVSVGFER